MPNIEIHGFGVNSREITAKVAYCLKPSPVAADIVISVNSDVVHDLKWDPKPYFRIVCTDINEVNLVVDLLKPLRIDMEVLLLHAFIPH